MFQILEKTMLCPTIAEIVVEAPRVAKAALPGQFLIIRDEEKGIKFT
jgi:NAD(P)H-flavin reductase